MDTCVNGSNHRTVFAAVKRLGPKKTPLRARATIADGVFISKHFLSKPILNLFSPFLIRHNNLMVDVFSQIQFHVTSAINFESKGEINQPIFRHQASIIFQVVRTCHSTVASLPIGGELIYETSKRKIFDRKIFAAKYRT